MNPTLIKSRTAEGTISTNRIVKPGAGDLAVLQGAAATDKLIGVATHPGGDAVTGDVVDVVMDGIADVELGNTVAEGDLLTSDATGRGVTAAPGAGINNRVVGMAMRAGVVGDIVPVSLKQGQIQG